MTYIGSYAFSGCTGLTSIYITDLAKWCVIDFKSNNANPLKYAGNLYLNGTLVTELKIPEGVTSIGNYAFEGCTGLTSIEIPNSVKRIGDSAFEGCTGLTNITVDSGNQRYHAAGNCLIETETKTLILGCKNSVIPSDGSVTCIGSSAFYSCIGLTSITIPSSVTRIGSSAFYSCIGLTSITIPSSVTRIGYYAFYRCTNLKSVTFKVTSGWYYSTDSTATSWTSLDLLSNATRNATYLTSTYCGYYWKRS